MKFSSIPFIWLFGIISRVILDEKPDLPILFFANLTERTAGVGAVPAAAHPHDEQLVTSLLFLQHTRMLYFYLLKSNIATYVQ